MRSAGRRLDLLHERIVERRQLLLAAAVDARDANSSVGMRAVAGRRTPSCPTRADGLKPARCRSPVVTCSTAALRPTDAKQMIAAADAGAEIDVSAVGTPARARRAADPSPR